MMPNRDWETIQDRRTIRWETFSDEEFVEFYWKVVAAEVEQEGYDPNFLQSASVYRELGFGRYLQAIRRHFDYSFREFLLEEVGVSREELDHEYNWPIDDAETKEWLDKFVIELRDRDSTKECESTIQRIAMNLYVFLHEWQEAHDTTDVIDTLRNADKTESYELTLAVYDRLNARDITENTKSRYVTDHSFWFDFLTLPTNPLDYNPIPDVQERFQWSRSEVDELERSALSTSQVQQLWKEADSLEERMLLIAACAWGLRAGEIGRLHVDQLVLEPDPESDYPGPVIEFAVRKQGPSTVNIVFGRQVVKNRISQLQQEYGSDWNGYLFPSTDRRTEHLQSRAILTHRFKPLAQRAEITVDDETPNLKQARRYWYQLYWRGQQRYHELVQLAAAEQGSSDPKVVEANYLGDLSRLEFSRLWVRRELGEAFDELSVEKEPIYMDNSMLETVRKALLDTLTVVDNTIQDGSAS